MIRLRGMLQAEHRGPGVPGSGGTQRGSGEWRAPEDFARREQYDESKSWKGICGAGGPVGRPQPSFV